MRLNYTDDEDRPGQFALWEANCRRSLASKAGQRELRELEAALLALPQKRLISEALETEEGVCAIGAYGKRKGIDLSKFDPEDGVESDDVGIAGGMPRLVAWSVVCQNDVILSTVWERHEGPVRPYHATYQGGIAHVRPMTPEERYERMLAWVRAQLVADAR